MKKLLWIFLFTAPLGAQISNPSIVPVASAPSGSCGVVLPDEQVISTGILYSCQSGTWASIGGGGTASLVIGTTPITGGANNLLFYEGPLGTLAGVQSADNAVVSTNSTGVPQVTATLPTGLALQTPGSGVITNLTGTCTSCGVGGNAATVTSVAGATGLTSGQITAAGGAMIQLAQTVVAGASTASVTFSAIPAGYSSILIKAVGAVSDSAANQTLSCKINGDSTSGDYGGYVAALGASPTNGVSLTPSSSGIGCANVAGATAPSNQGDMFQVEIVGYAGTVFTKRFGVISVNQSTGTGLGYSATDFWTLVWNSTAAVTSIAIADPAGGHYIAGTTFTLYGIL